MYKIFLQGIISFLQIVYLSNVDSKRVGNKKTYISILKPNNLNNLECIYCSSL